MRQGRILSEGDAKFLMMKYNVSSMERLFLKLSQEDDCRSQKNRKNFLSKIERIDNFPETSSYLLSSPQSLQVYIDSKLNRQRQQQHSKPVEHYRSIDPESLIVENEFKNSHLNNRSVSSFDRIAVQCRKHRIRLFRRIPELMITMLLPALEVALFCLCMGRDPTSIPIAVCNLENPPFLSLFFLQSFETDLISLKNYQTPEAAVGSVRNADTYAAMIISKDFAQILQHVEQNGFNRIQNERTNRSIETDTSSMISIHYDGSNALHVNVIRREIFDALFRFIDIASKIYGRSKNDFQMPIKFEKPIYGSEKTDMVEFVGPGLMVFIVFFATMTISSMAFISERREGEIYLIW